MTALTGLIASFGPLYGIIALALILLIVIVISINPILVAIDKANKGIKDVGSQTPKKDSEPDLISSGKAITINGSILIYLFELHTKFKETSLIIKNKTIGRQMDYAQNIHDQILNKLVKLYRKAQEEKINELKELKTRFKKLSEEELENNLEYQKVKDDFIYIKDNSSIVSKEFMLYKEALRSAFKVDLTNSLRSSFKENGFYNLDDEKIKPFVAKKVESFSIIITEYLSTYFPMFSNMLIKINDEASIEKIIDEKYFFEKTLDIYKKARDIWNNEYLIEDAKLKLEFEKSINTLLLKDLFK